jgi:hypothetical protein
MEFLFTENAVVNNRRFLMLVPDGDSFCAVFDNGARVAIPPETAKGLIEGVRSLRPYYSPASASLAPQADKVRTLNDNFIT